MWTWHWIIGWERIHWTSTAAKHPQIVQMPQHELCFIAWGTSFACLFSRKHLCGDSDKESSGKLRNSKMFTKLLTGRHKYLDVSPPPYFPSILQKNKGQGKHHMRSQKGGKKDQPCHKLFWTWCPAKCVRLQFTESRRGLEGRSQDL